ncbi:type VI secretion system-associated FHA domain protein [Parasulfitobacter algicola]|uniref:FHA domain-containing protein n=1 Tax=Parasulfitobacter algicola TaxID=2614809 RepID=A0ABX2IMH6_9RHOB|nr:type VI secretion system-associated FHA domain protein [Sulfitobacter algicola]NSX53730.1 hypothetical protein [Sulfitobacter algicola]
MSLTLEITGGPYVGQVRVIDGRSAFSVGTMRDCNWILPTTGSDEIKVTIRSGGTGFQMVTEGAVQIEGQPVIAEKPMDIGHGSQIAIAEHRLSARIEQAHSSTWDTKRDEFSAPTISSILSDVTPGGAGASGVLPGRAGEEWMSPNAVLPREDASPMITQPINQLGSKLPDDWDVPEDRTNQQSQATVTNQVINIGNTAEKAEPHPEPQVDLDLLRVFLEAAGLSIADITAQPDAVMHAAGQTLRTAIEGIERLEQEAQKFEAELDLNTLPASDVDRAAASLDVLLGFAGVDTANQTRSRIDTLITKQKAVTLAIDATLSRARQDLAPDSIETKAAVDSGLPFGKRMRYWDTYIKEWSSDNAPLGKNAFKAAYDDATTGIGKEDE